MRRESENPSEPFADDGLERLIERAERDPGASEELDFLADLVAAAELERPRLERPQEPAPLVSQLLLERQWIWAVAASVLFAGVLCVWFLRGHQEPRRARDLAQREAPRYIASDLRTDETAGDPLAGAMQRYATGDYSGAAEGLAAWLDSHPEHGPARF